MSQPRLGTHIAEVKLNEDNEVVRETLLDLFFDLDFTENWKNIEKILCL